MVSQGYLLSPNEMKVLLTVIVNSVVYTLNNFNVPFPVTALY